MKRLAILALCALIATSLSLIALAAERVAIVLDVGGRGDLSFNDMGFKGTDQAARDFGLEVVEVQSASGADYLPNLRNLARAAEYDLIIAVGFLLGDALGEVAEEFPEQKFAIIDVDWVTGPNIMNIVFRENEVSALIGCLATLIAADHGYPATGIVLGIPIPVLYHFEAGYRFGADWASERFEQITGTTADVALLYNYTGTFSDIALGKAASDAILAQGAVGIYNVAGPLGVGDLEAITEYHWNEGTPHGPPFYFGVDANQDWMGLGQHTLASGMKRVDVATYMAVRAVVEGTFEGGVFSLGLAEGGVAISKIQDLDEFIDFGIQAGAIDEADRDLIIENWFVNRSTVSEWIWEVVDELELGILDGSIQVPTANTDAEIASIRQGFWPRPQPTGFTFEGGIPQQAGKPIGLAQDTLVIYVRASDDSTANRAALRTSEQAEFTQVASFFRESSFNQISFNFTHAPAAGNWYQLPDTYDAYMWTNADITAAVAAKDAAAEQQARDSQGLVQDFGSFFTDALQEAQDDGHNIKDFGHVIVVMIGPFHRGTSYSAATFNLKDSGGKTVQAKVPVIVVTTDTGWSRSAHEIGHGFAKWDDFYDVSGPGLPRQLGNWDIMDCTDCGSQTIVWHKDFVSKWYNSTHDFMKTIARPAGTNRIDKTYTLIPYETESPAAGSVQAVRLDVGGSVHLYIMNRQKIAGQVGSQSIPSNGVIIVDANDAEYNKDLNVPALLFGGPLVAGDTWTNQAYGKLTIKVSAVAGSASNLKVEIGWGPDPYYDLEITKWNPPPWESEDIWVDSPFNGWGTFEDHDAAGDATGNGDRPQLFKTNRLYAQVSNEGNVPVKDVEVYFYETTPPGIGVTGNWSLIDKDKVDVPANGSVKAQVDWVPRRSTHTCIRVVVAHQTGELNASNNEAQENIGDFNTTAASPWKPIESEIQVENPAPVYQTMRLEADGLPEGWTLWVSERFVTLAPGESRLVSYRIDPGEAVGFDEGSKIDISVQGSMVGVDQDTVIGGVTAEVHLVRASSIGLREAVEEQVSLAWTLSSPEDEAVSAFVAPAAAGLPVTLEVWEVGASTYSLVLAYTDGLGIARFYWGDITSELRLKSGLTYGYRLYLYGSDSIDSAVSSVGTFVVAP